MAKTLEGVSTSDWHLDGGVARLFPLKALEKQIAEINKPYQYCIEQGVRYMFVPGDLSDKARISEETFIALVALWLKYDKFVEMHYIAGNHDFTHVGKTSLDVLKVFCDNSVFKNVYIHDAVETLDFDGVDVTFVPYPATSAGKSSKGRLVFAHVAEVGAIGDNGIKLKVVDHRVSRGKKDYVISGHLHTPQVLESSRICFNGSLYQKTFGESLPKGFVHFKATSHRNGDLGIKIDHINSRPDFILENRTITCEADWDLLEEGEHVFYKLTLAEGVIAPKSITRDMPNIININGTTYRGREVVESGKLESESNVPRITPLTFLIDFLHRFDLDKKEIKEAVGMVKEAMQELGIAE